MNRSLALAELDRLRGRLVVSCQAREDNPLHGPRFMAAMALAAIAGGAVGIRADGVAVVTAIRDAIGPQVPIMGIFKVKQLDGSLFITPTAEAALAIHAAGGAALADVGTIEDALYAVSCGIDAVGTTLSGYTPDSPKSEGPDFVLLERLVRECPVPVFAEGRIWTREEARQAKELGAAFVVVGTAITNPTAITARIVAALQE